MKHHTDQARELRVNAKSVNVNYFTDKAHSLSAKAHAYTAKANSSHTYFGHTKARIAHEKAHQANLEAASRAEKRGDTELAEMHRGKATTHEDHVVYHAKERMRVRRDRYRKGVDVDENGVVVKAQYDPKDTHSWSEVAHEATGKTVTGKLKKGSHEDLALHHSMTALKKSRERNSDHASDHHLEAHDYHTQAAESLHSSGDSGKRRLREAHLSAARAHWKALQRHISHPHSTEEKSVPQIANAVTVKSDDGSTMSPAPESKQEGPKMGAGHRAIMNAVQAIHDICSTLEQEGGESDDLSLRKYCKKFCEKLKDHAGDGKARAEKHAKKLNGQQDATDDTDDPMDEDDYKPSKEEKAIEVDADGGVIVKSFPNWKARRYTAKNLTEPVVAKTGADNVDPPKESKESKDATTEVKATFVSPEEEAAIIRRMKRVNKQFKELEVAAVANGLLPATN